MAFGNITTPMAPQDIYSPQQTNAAANNAFNNSLTSMRYAQKQFDRPGVSRSAGTEYAAMPQVAGGVSTGQDNAASQRLSDYADNTNNQLGYQQMQGNWNNQNSNLLNSLLHINNQYQLSSNNNQISNLQQLLGLLPLATG
jgi:hypothetical protein